MALKILIMAKLVPAHIPVLTLVSSLRKIQRTNPYLKCTAGSLTIFLKPNMHDLHFVQLEVPNLTKQGQREDYVKKRGRYKIIYSSISWRTRAFVCLFFFEYHVFVCLAMRCPTSRTRAQWASRYRPGMCPAIQHHFPSKYTRTFREVFTKCLSISANLITPTL